MKSIFHPLLYLFSILYGLIIRFRNHLYDISYSKSVSFDIPVVVVGNLRVGGSGKTPFIEYLINLLKEKFQISTLSRGYKRKTFGFRLARLSDTPATIGDEPFQIFQKYTKQIAVAVGEDRAYAIPQILMERPEINLILMDDGFQHRQVSPTFAIVLSDYKFPLISDQLLPLGRLREPISQLRRAQALVITKCPIDISQEEKEEITKSIHQKSGVNIPIFFAGYSLGEKVNSRVKSDLSSYILVTAVADPSRVLGDFEKLENISGSFFYPDHYAFTEKDVESWAHQFPEVAAGRIGILCTEKDIAKIQISVNKERWKSVCLSYFPIQMKFLDGEEKFQELLFSALRSSGLSQND
jgi:tetraacyldisaccharide 4'-kinase